MDPFDVLGLDSGADEDAIERAYRERVKEAHPDQGGSAAEFRRVRDACETITSGEAAIEPADPTTGDGDREHRRTDDDAREEGTDAGGDGGAEHTVEFLDYDVLADHGWGIGDPDLFEKAARADVGPPDYGQLTVGADESLLEAAEGAGYAWPFACRGGACANCAVAVESGDLDQPADAAADDRDRVSCHGSASAGTLRRRDTHGSRR